MDINPNNVQMDEQFITKKQDEDARKYERNYSQYINDAADTFNETYKKFGKDWSTHDTVALGQYLEQWEQYCGMFEALPDATTRDTLGDYMKVGLGLAAIQYVSLPASFLASVNSVSRLVH